MIEGRADDAATEAYATSSGAAPAHFRRALGVTLSSIGLGTYLGRDTDEDDARVEAAVAAAYERGVNVFDTAINYRLMRAERSVGRALAKLAKRDPSARSRVFVATKGGFLVHDGESALPARRWYEENLIRTGVLRSGDVAAGCHAMSPRFVEAMLERSRANLGLATLDLYYLHNPETQLEDTPIDVVHDRLRAAFTTLEKAVDDGRVARYGVATWAGFRSRRAEPGHLEVETLVDLATEARRDAGGGGRHHFAAVQAPLNLAMRESLEAETQTVDGKPATLLDACARLGLTAFASASLGQGRFLHLIPKDVELAFPEARTPAQRALQFTRSAPGLACALVGAKAAAHVEDNFALAKVPPADADVVRRLLVPRAEAR